MAMSPKPHPLPLATPPTRIPTPVSSTRGHVPVSYPNTPIPYPWPCSPTHVTPLISPIRGRVHLSTTTSCPPAGARVICKLWRHSCHWHLLHPPSGVWSTRGGCGQPRLSLALIECPSVGISGADVGRQQAGDESWQPSTMRDRLEQLRAVRGAGHHGGHTGVIQG